jgi:CBS domain containing-hemolysin-like protein
MASSDDTSVPPEPKPARRGGLSGFFGIGRREEEAEAARVQAVRVLADDLIDQAVAFQSLRVSDVMTPRADINAVEVDTPFSEVVAQFRESEHSRLPVYRETLDDPLGVVHLKDLFKLLADPDKPPSPTEPALHRIKREPLYVPPSMRAADLLLKMQAQRTHMALVIDEFGGVDGLVTLEDVIESVVGDIDDEHDEAHPIQVTRSPAGFVEADARAPLEDLESVLEVSLMTEALEGEEIETVAGLVTGLAGRVPQRGEVIAHPAGWEFEVTDADPRRVKRVRVRPAPAAPPAPAPED